MCATHRSSASEPRCIAPFHIRKSARRQNTDSHPRRVQGKFALQSEHRDPDRYTPPPAPSAGRCPRARKEGELPAAPRGGSCGLRKFADRSKSHTSPRPKEDKHHVTLPLAG